MSVLIRPTGLSLLMEAGPVVVIDTRHADTWARGHVPGAVNPADIQRCLAEVDPTEFDAHVEALARVFGEAGLSGDQTAVLYDDGLQAGLGMAGRAYLALSQLGYPRIRVLDGGYQGWQAAGMPLETADSTTSCAALPVECPPTVFPVASVGGALACKGAVLDAIRRGNAVLLDVREEDEWQGKTSSPIDPDYCPRRGRLPGARWLSATHLTRYEAGNLAPRSVAAIRDECLAIGITPGTPVILYCFRGNRATSSYVLLKDAGIENVRVYAGSWDEWSRDPSLPVEEGLPTYPRHRAVIEMAIPAYTRRRDVIDPASHGFVRHHAVVESAANVYRT